MADGPAHVVTLPPRAPAKPLRAPETPVPATPDPILELARLLARVALKTQDRGPDRS